MLSLLVERLLIKHLLRLPAVESDQKKELTWIGHPFRFEGSLGTFKSPVGVLLDSGCTANVISRTLVQELNLTMTDCPLIEARFANGVSEILRHVVHVSVTVGTFVDTIPCFVGDIDEDIILGVPFLSSIVITRLDWANRILWFEKDGVVFLWTGTRVRRALLIKSSELHTLPASTRVFEINLVETTGPPVLEEKEGPRRDAKDRLQSVLHEYRDIFYRTHNFTTKPTGRYTTGITRGASLAQVAKFGAIK